MKVAVFAKLVTVWIATLIVLVATRSAVAEPAQSLLGDWEAESTVDNHAMRVSWNPSAARYEGVLIRQSAYTQKFGFRLGDLLWIATTTANPNALQIQEARRYAVNGPTSWLKGVLRQDLSKPGKMFTSLTWFTRIGAPPPQPAPVSDPLIQADLAAAKAKNVDMSIFGIKVGERLALPVCEGNLTASDSCVNKSGGLFSEMNALLLTSRMEDLPGAQKVIVQIARDRCPDWLSFCALGLTVKNGIVYAALARVSGVDGQANIEKRLSEKYHSSPDKKRSVECRNDHGVVLQSGPLRVWRMPGLSVTYNPLGAGCSVGVALAGSGLIWLETDAFRATVIRHSKEQEDSQPKM